MTTVAVWRGVVVALVLGCGPAVWPGTPPEPTAEPRADALRAEQDDRVRGEIVLKLASDRPLAVTFAGDGVPQVGLAEFDRLNRRHRVTEMARVFTSRRASRALPNVFKLSLSPGVDVSAAVRRYERVPEVLYAEPNYLLQTFALPNDPYFPLQWSLSQPSDHDIDAPEAWDVGTGSPEVVVAVIDTGLDWGHPDLAASVWTNPGEKLNGEDSDGNGFVDDVRGWDFVDTSQAVAAGEDGTEPDNDPMDFYGHGTLVAGIVGATTDNGLGIAGTCWGCKLMAVRVGFATPVGLGLLEAEDAAAGIVYAADNGADVINMSWGREWVAVIADAVDYASSAGVVLIAAGGNDAGETPRYPAGLDNVIAVAATDEGDARPAFSSYGSWVDVSAPGTAIVSTYVNGQYLQWLGTSTSAAHVSGVAALTLSKSPELSALEVRTLLRSTTDPLDGPEYIGLGRINAHAAILPNTTPVADLSSALDGATLAGPVVISGTAGGTGFGDYTVLHGTGIYPSDWSVIGSSAQEVNEGPLATWDTRTVPDGRYTVRLAVTDDSGRTSQDMTVLTTENVWLSDPRAYSIFRPSQTLEIRGNAGGPVFQSYTVDWGCGEDPDQWFDTGISLLDDGQQPVADGLLAMWDTSAVATDSIVTVRLVASFGGFQDFSYARGIVFDTMLQQGWPRPIGEPVVSSPMLASLDGGNGLQIVVLGENGLLRALRSDGSDQPGWPRQTPGGWRWDHNSTPALADLDGDDLPEVIVPSFDGGMHVFGPDGEMLWQTWPSEVEHLYNSPTVADLDADGTAEILQRTDSALLVLDRDGNETDRWPRDEYDHSVAVADVDGDGAPEIALGGPSVYLMKADGSIVAGWPQEVYDEVRYGGPVIGDVDGDGEPEICAITAAGWGYAFNADGSTVSGWPRSFFGSFVSRPVLADVDGDRALEILAGTASSPYFRVVRGDGTELPGWPKSTPMIWPGVRVGWSPAVVADVDGDDAPEVFTVSEATSLGDEVHPSKIHAWHSDGTTVSGWPKTLPADAALSAPALGDVDDDGRLELVVTDEEGSVYVFDLAQSDASTELQWSLLQHDRHHTSASPFLPFELCDDGVDNDYDGFEDCEDGATCEGLPCTDGAFCTSGDTCEAGVCLAGVTDTCPEQPCDEVHDVCVGPIWWDDDWLYRKRLEIQGPTAGYQMALTVHWLDGFDDPGLRRVDCEYHCKEDFSDLRFVSDGQALPYWIETVEAGAARIWIRTEGTGTIHMYYGNADAFPVSDGHATFLFFDDFASDSLTLGAELDSTITASRGIPPIDAGGSFEALSRIDAIEGHELVETGATVLHLELTQAASSLRYYSSGFRGNAGEYHEVQVHDGGAAAPLASASGYAYADGAPYTVSLVRDTVAAEIRGSVFAYGDRFAGSSPLTSQTITYPDASYDFVVDRYRISASTADASDNAYVAYDSSGSCYELSGDMDAEEVRERIHWIAVKLWQSSEPVWTSFGDEQWMEQGDASCCEYVPFGTCSASIAVPQCNGWLADACCGDGNSNGLDDGCESIVLQVNRGQLAWTSHYGASAYDVVHGDLGVLRSTAGDFAAATVECLADDHVGSSIPHTAGPVSTGGSWFLVRGVGPTGNMTYGTVASCVVEIRDDGIEASPAACD